MADAWSNHPISSTYISDPHATHRVVSLSKNYGSGIQGFYTNEFHAHQMAKFFRDRGDSDVAVELHDPKNIGGYGIHPLVEKAMEMFR